MQGAVPCSAQQDGAQGTGGSPAPQPPAPLSPGRTNLAHTSQPHSRRSPAHFSMENIKGSANQKKSPAGDQEILPCHADLGVTARPGRVWLQSRVWRARSGTCLPCETLQGDREKSPGSADGKAATKQPHWVFSRVSGAAPPL